MNAVEKAIGQYMGRAVTCRDVVLSKVMGKVSVLKVMGKVFI